MKNNLEVLPNPPDMTPAQALGQARAELAAGEITDVLVLAYTDHGTVRIINSRMTRAEANWLIDCGKTWTLDPNEHT